MATAFPGGVDSFPNPVGTDLLDNAVALLKHATQHANDNDAINAIETQLNLTGLLTGSGVPGAGLGVNTNLYIDTASGIIYRKTAGSWAAIYTPSGGLQRGEIPPCKYPVNFNTSANAFKGFLFTPSVNVNVQSLTACLGQVSTGQTYQGKVCTLTSNAVGATTIASVVGSTDVITVTNTTGASNSVVIPAHCTTPIALTAGTTYAILFGCTSAGGTFATNLVADFTVAANLKADQIPGSMGDNVVSPAAPPIATSAATVSAAVAGSTGVRLVVGIVATF